MERSRSWTSRSCRSVSSCVRTAFSASERYSCSRASAAFARQVEASFEVGEDGKTLRFYELTPFSVVLTPETIAAAVPTLTTPESVQGDGQEGRT